MNSFTEGEHSQRKKCNMRILYDYEYEFVKSTTTVYNLPWTCDPWVSNLFKLYQVILLDLLSRFWNDISNACFTYQYREA